MVDPVAVIAPVRNGAGSIVDFVVTFSNGRPGAPRAGSLLSTLWPVDATLQLLPHYRDVLAGADLVLDAVLIPGVDGADRYVDIRAARLDEAEVIATWRDVTSRVEAEEALADSEALLRGAFDEAPAGALLIGLAGEVPGEVLKVNRTFAELTGYRQQELLAMPFTRLLHPDDLAAGATAAQLLERAGEPLRLRRADGGEVWVRLGSAQVSLGDQPAYLVVHVEDVTSTREIEQQLADRTLYDPLTGLANRHLLLDRFRLAVDNLARHPGAIVVLRIDLDRFKDINDSYGHTVGDYVLAEVGRRLSALVDSPDTAARLAGDEFAIVTAARTGRRAVSWSANGARTGKDARASGTVAAATNTATRLADEVTRVLSEQMRPPGEDEVVLSVSASIGIAVATSPESDPEQLLLQADRAMYEAKRRGRRRYELFRQSLSSAAHERLRVEQEAREAVANGWLRLHYQPVIDLTTGRLGGAEALLRIDHPERGLLAPGSFIDVLEDSDLIVPIGEWVLNEACRQLHEWQQLPGLADFSMAVNVSGRQASDHEFAGLALGAVKTAGVDPRRLCLEMTERMLIDADESVAADLHRLTAEGIQIALDDFGTGYASLSYLQRFPVSTLKIDRSFVTGVGVTATDTAIVASIVALAHALELDVVAEGVETVAQLEQLRIHHCAKAQGYFFAPPLDAGQFAKALQDEVRKLRG